MLKKSNVAPRDRPRAKRYPCTTHLRRHAHRLARSLALALAIGEKLLVRSRIVPPPSAVSPPPVPPPPC
eukprot:3239555-Prymnesium_polylepis.1